MHAREQASSLKTDLGNSLASGRCWERSSERWAGAFWQRHWAVTSVKTVSVLSACRGRSGLQRSLPQCLHQEASSATPTCSGHSTASHSGLTTTLCFKTHYSPPPVSQSLPPIHVTCTRHSLRQSRRHCHASAAVEAPEPSESSEGSRKNKGLNSHTLGCPLGLATSQLWCWKSHWASRGLHFPICKMRVLNNLWDLIWF